MKQLFIFLLISSTCLMAQDFQTEDSSNPVCVIKTSLGDVYVELFSKEAPKTVENFLGLAEGTKEYKDATGNDIKGNFYDGLIFHRVIKGFMVQGGCPRGNGTGGPGYRFEDEMNATALDLHKKKALGPNFRPHPQLGIRSNEHYNWLISNILGQMGVRTPEAFQKRKAEVHNRLGNLMFKEVFELMGYKYNASRKSHHPKKGVIAMANSGPNTNGSQFFINLVDTPHLTGRHTVFGKVVKGMDVVEKIGETKVGAGSRPEKDIKIISIRKHK